LRRKKAVRQRSQASSKKDSQGEVLENRQEIVALITGRVEEVALPEEGDSSCYQMGGKTA
jgi:hypothetical protein